MLQQGNGSHDDVASRIARFGADVLGDAFVQGGVLSDTFPFVKIKNSNFII